jgi:hypothetical protein
MTEKEIEKQIRENIEFSDWWMTANGGGPMFPEVIETISSIEQGFLPIY